ncbi:hypothetical protein OMAG_000588 [Candidatus Omnitrophus magneticus]|uniref:Uncharacterized protein n=1 Tax=Candidatus Omnitrophus magneticus TaxID=1609969 RepID=A0A0F0CQC6_9BACT|nr:hypothetical protein OMAG_000588 [Candidatus Omnitrophus magneticus]
MYFKSIKIKGYKGFVDSGEIPLCVPDGKTLGSGLNIFVGENGSGKTALLKAISLLSINSFTGQNRISSSDFNNKNQTGSIEVIGTLSEHIKYPMPEPWKKELDIKEFRIAIKHRDRKAPGKLLSPMFTVSNILEPISRTMPATKTKEQWELTDYYLGFDSDRLGDDGLNIFFFDSSRNKHAKKGYSTTFSRVMNDLNWKFLKDANQPDILTKWKTYYKDVVSEKLGSEIKDLFKERFHRDDLINIELELLNLKEPFSEAFFALVNDINLTQIPLEDLGSGIELLFSILFLRQIANQSKGTIIYCIDEPELSLHPQWQKSFFEILIEESKTKQVFIATHSLHFIDPIILGAVKRFYIKDEMVKYASLDDAQVSDFELRRLFSLENREIFFSRGIALVEGIQDRYRLRLFLKSGNKDLFVINGLSNLERVKKLCDKLAINFKAIVDLDFLSQYPDLLPSLTDDEKAKVDEVKVIEGMIANQTDEKVKKILMGCKADIFNPDKQRCLCSKIRTKMASDKAYKDKVNKKISELVQNNIFVLSNGMMEDYLDKDGNPLSKKLGDELEGILK